MAPPAWRGGTRCLVVVACAMPSWLSERIGKPRRASGSRRTEGWHTPHADHRAHAFDLTDADPTRGSRDHRLLEYHPDARDCPARMRQSLGLWMGRGTWPSPRCAHDPWADSRRSGQETQGAPHLRGGRAGSGGGSSAWAASQVSSSQQCLLRTGDNISHAGDISIFYKCITSITSMVWRIDVASICMHVLLHMHTRRAALPEQRMPRSSPRKYRC